MVDEKTKKIAQGYLRGDGQIGIRNKLMVFFTVNCSSYVAREIVERLDEAGISADLLGNESCYDNQFVIDCLLRLAVHPNTGAVLVVGHGCEFIQAEAIADTARRHKRPADVIFVQEMGTSMAIEEGCKKAKALVSQLHDQMKVPLKKQDLCLGILQAGKQDKAVQDRMLTVCRKIIRDGGKVLLAGGFPGNLSCYHGASAEINASEITGVCKVTQQPSSPGFWLIDVLQEQEREYPRSGIAYYGLAMACSGAHMICLFTSQGVTVGSTAAPLLNITWSGTGNGHDDADFLADCLSVEEMESYLLKVADGEETCAEKLGWRENVLLRRIQKTCCQKE